ncbi:hypothetical protein [Actinomadura oligospora]|uniref:hypothetical protein n=1 Tax=Actinomadura oligospora TaxID=111804 RepID=UPI0004793425|nr:hypothetical protein [Actinomadura oligospora]
MDELERACAMLRYCWRAVVNDERDTEELGNAFTETRWLYEAARRPDDLAVTTGLAALAFTRLQAHTQGEVLMPMAWGESYDEGAPLAVLDEDDETGRLLAKEAIQTARRALDADPDDNLSALTLGLALETLDETGAAIDAYRRALRTDPGDLDVELRLRALGVEAPPAPDKVCRHPQGFFLLKVNARVSNSDWGDWVWLFADHTRIRPMADEIVSDHHWEGSFEDGDDDRWDPASGAFDPSPDNSLHLIVHQPGEPEATIDVYHALRRAPNGTVSLDWSALPLPGPLAPRLSPHRPVRADSMTYFPGVNGPEWEDAERP